ncbi:hypothetical protein [uncultured Cohaesibacter sp.]|nr:hypothetical protein [uncultured Cohaesibacter sp.]
MGETKIEKIIPFLLPVFLVLFGVLMLVTYIPELTLFLPRLIGV